MSLVPNLHIINETLIFCSESEAELTADCSLSSDSSCSSTLVEMHSVSCETIESRQFQSVSLFSCLTFCEFLHICLKLIEFKF